MNRQAAWSVGGALGILALGGVATELKHPRADAQQVQVTPSAGPQGPQGIQGNPGSAANIYGSPTSRTLALATAFQASDVAKPAVVTINLSSAATMSLSGGTTNTADVVIGSTNAVASGTGTAICRYNNSNTGALTIGLSLTQTATQTCTFALPTGWFFAVRQTAGTVTITSGFDQSVG